MSNKLMISGIPETVSETTAALCRSRLLMAVNKLLEESNLNKIDINIRNYQNSDIDNSRDNTVDSQSAFQGRIQKYKSQNPLFSFEQLIVPEKIMEDLLLAIELINLETQVFDQWGLRKIEPFPRTALNFHGQPGTGKTLAAHAIASKINSPILVASYAQIESMYHGEGPKNVEAVFKAAERDKALLFIDEADSLLSKRLTNVTQGSEQAINSMRSQLLICLERFKGVVIFSTNLAKNYDKAFETRVRHVYFPLPDERSRYFIWKKHLPPEIPLSNDFDLKPVAHIDDVCGRDIKNAVIDAAMRAARLKQEYITTQDLLDSIHRIKKARINTLQDSENTDISPEEKEAIKTKIKRTLSDQD